MSEKIENLKSVLKIYIFANTTQKILQVNYFKKLYYEMPKRFTFCEISKISKIR